MIWSFTTISQQPTLNIINVTPASGAVNVPVPEACKLFSVTVTFNAEVNVSSATFTLTNSSNQIIPSTIWYSKATNTITLTPQLTEATVNTLSSTQISTLGVSVYVQYSTLYTASISGVKDLSGNTLSTYSWSFTTGNTVTSYVLSTSPPYNATYVDISTPIAFYFNEYVTPIATLTDSNYNNIPFTLSYSDINTMHVTTLTPNSQLSYGITYIATMNDNILIFTTIDEGVLPFAYQSNLEYIGGFRVPNIGQAAGVDTFDYNGRGLGYNPNNNSLFLSGFNDNTCFANISIPSIVNSSNINNLNTCTVIQPFVNLLSVIPNTSQFNGEGQINTGDFKVVNNQIIGTLYVYYTGSTITQSHFRFDSLDLSTAIVEGMFVIGSQGLDAAMYDGYMTPIPSIWQSVLGAPYITGNDDVPVIGRTSSGPAAFGFNPSNLNSSTTIPYVYYPLSNPLAPVEPATLLYDENSRDGGVYFIPGTKSILFFGSAGTNTTEYGDDGTGSNTAWNDDNRSGKGAHSINGLYSYQVLAYDVNDFIAVVNGQMQPYQVRPYAAWFFDFPQEEGSKYITGVDYDPSTGNLYVVQYGGDTEASYSYLPVIQVFKFIVS